jgi:hypothetical protein
MEVNPKQVDLTYIYQTYTVTTAFKRSFSERNSNRFLDLNQNHMNIIEEYRERVGPHCLTTIREEKVSLQLDTMIKAKKSSSDRTAITRPELTSYIFQKMSFVCGVS